MSDRGKRVTAVLLMVVSAALILIPGIRFMPVPDAEYPASGREWYPDPVSVYDGEININTADQALLQTLPGIGETIAGLIVEERQANGDFYYPEDLTAVRGIGRKKMEQIREMIGF